jgi:hypothetical protein
MKNALCVIILGLTPLLGAHTLPISHIRLTVAPEFLHMEVTFNPFELSFISEVDDNRDRELDAIELKKHGDMIARRVCAALRVTVGTNVVAAENVGMDPDLSGHHARLRAHYKVDARAKPVILSSDLNTITSASHLTQVTFISGGLKQLAQLDSLSKKAAFNEQPRASAKSFRPMSVDTTSRQNYEQPFHSNS